MASKHTVADTLASYPTPVTLRRVPRMRYAELLGAVVPLALGLQLLQPGRAGHLDATTRHEQVAIALFLTVAAATTIIRAVRDLASPCSLTLDANGFRVVRGRRRITYRWTDVQ